MNIYLFTTKTCHKCPEAKTYLDSLKLNYQIMKVDENQKAMELAARFKLMTVPMIVTENNNKIIIQTLHEFKNDYR